MNIPQIGETWTGLNINRRETFTVESIIPQTEYLLEYVSELEKSDKWLGDAGVERLVTAVRERAARGGYNPNRMVYKLAIHEPDGSMRKSIRLDKDFNNERYWKDLHRID